MYSTKVPSFQLQGRPAHHSGRAGVEVLVAESQNSGSMPCQFGIETVVVTWDAGELEEDATYRDEEILSRFLPFPSGFPAHPLR